MSDLHSLTREHGVEKIATAMSRSSRAVRGMRCGETAMTIDDLYALVLAFPGFDVKNTVLRIGSIRSSKDP